jgi:alpha-tubulin suppressor-like RCC1 family protein
MDEFCALTGDHRTFCWRHDSTYISIDPVPALLDTPEPLVSLGAGSGVFGRVFCGQAESGAVYCWGNFKESDVGYQISDGLTAVKIGEGFLVGSLAVGTGHACALAADSTAQCWGSYISGKRGVSGPYPTSGQLASYVDLQVKPVFGDVKFRQLVAGEEHTCGIRTDGTVACWGDSAAVGAPGHPFLHENDTCYLVAACTVTPVLLNGMSGAYTLASGGRHTCAISGGGLRCWGSNFSGELGLPDPSAGATPVTPVLPITPVSVTTGGMHSCALSAEGAAYCWGDNNYGQFGAGFQSAAVQATRVQFPGRFARLSAGYLHTCGIDPAGRLYCWGDDFPESTTFWHGSLPVRVPIPQ